MEREMEDRPIRLRTEVTVAHRGGATERGVIVARTYSNPIRYDVATADKILTDVFADQIDE